MGYVRLRMVLGIVLVAVGLGGLLLLTPAPRVAEPSEIIATQTDWSYQLRPGQLIRLKGVPMRRVTQVPDLLTPVAATQGAAKDADATFRATGFGVGMLQATFECACDRQQITRSFGVIVSTRGFDLALTSLDSNRRFLLTVGQELVFGYAGTDVSSSDNTALGISPNSWELADGLTAFRALKPGRSVLSFQGFWSCSDADTCEESPPQPLMITVLISPPSQPFRWTETQEDAGRTLHVHQGDTVEFVMHQSDSLGPWQLGSVDYQDRLLDVIYPSQPAQAGITTFPFVASALGTTYLNFGAAPAGCLPSEACPRFSPQIQLTVVVDP